MLVGWASNENDLAFQRGHRRQFGFNRVSCLQSGHIELGHVECSLWTIRLFGSGRRLDNFRGHPGGAIGTGCVRIGLGWTVGTRTGTRGIVFVCDADEGVIYSGSSPGRHGDGDRGSRASPRTPAGVRRIAAPLIVAAVRCVNDPISYRGRVARRASRRWDRRGRSRRQIGVGRTDDLSHAARRELVGMPRFQRDDGRRLAQSAGTGQMDGAGRMDMVTAIRLKMCKRLKRYVIRQRAVRLRGNRRSRSNRARNKRMRDKRVGSRPSPRVRLPQQPAK